RIPVLIGYTLLNCDGEDLVAFILDLTERKRTEQALKDSDRRKDEFLAMLAHELRNPLAAIRTAVHILMLKGPQQPELNWGREVIDRQAKHLTRLIEDLLDVSRISTGKIQLKPVPVDVREVVARAVESVQPMMEAKSHDLKIHLPTEPLLAMADSSRLEQVLGNLLTNAAKYTDQGGSISVQASREGATLALRVRDNGIGLSAEMLPHIFNLYTQVEGAADRSLGGLGIGLTLVKLLVELHGGTVSAASEGPGLGSEFTITLPALESTIEVAERSGEYPVAFVEPDAGRQRPRVLVVDDNVDMAKGLAMVIEAAGFEVRTADDGTSALATAREFAPAFVLLDIGLPGMNGYEVAESIRAGDRTRRLTLIAISGYSQANDSERALVAGFDHHLLKPVDLRVLLPILTRGHESPSP
ncbi:MAG: ATP-binding protein, partial [Isosphaeraceae bacterium]